MLALVRIPFALASMTPRLMPRLAPKSSPLTIRRFILAEGRDSPRRAIPRSRRGGQDPRPLRLLVLQLAYPLEQRIARRDRLCAAPIEVERSKRADGVTQIRRIELNPPIAAPESELRKERVLGERSVHTSDRVDGRLHLAADRSVGRDGLIPEISVDVACPLSGRRGHSTEQQRSVILETDGG